MSKYVVGKFAWIHAGVRIGLKSLLKPNKILDFLKKN